MKIKKHRKNMFETNNPATEARMTQHKTLSYLQVLYNKFYL